MTQENRLNKENYYYCRICVRFRLLDGDEIKVMGENDKPPICSKHNIEMERYA
jgi:hypothetical protein